MLFKQQQKTTVSCQYKPKSASVRKIKNVSRKNKPVRVKVKVKFTLEQATKAQRGSRDTALLFI
jgi:hypothetical protein